MTVRKISKVKGKPVKKLQALDGYQEYFKGNSDHEITKPFMTKRIGKIDIA